MLEGDDDLKAVIQHAAEHSLKVDVSIDGECDILSVLIGKELYCESLYQGETSSVNGVDALAGVDKKQPIDLSLRVKSIWLRLFPDSTEPEMVTGIHIYRLD